MAPSYLVLTLVPEGLRGQVIDGQSSVQVADSRQRHPEQRGAPGQLMRPWVPAPGLLSGPPAQGAPTSLALPGASGLQAKALAHTHTLQKPKDSTELDSLSSPSPRLGWEATVSGLKTPTTYEREEGTQNQTRLDSQCPNREERQQD